VVEAEVSAGTIRRRLTAVWLLLAVLIGAIVAIEYADSVRQRPDPETDARMLLPVPVSQLGAIEVAQGGVLHRFERDAAGAWFYHGVHTKSQGAHTHQTDPAMAERIEQALTVFGRTRVERQFPLGAGGKDYGVAAPQVVVLLYRPNELQPIAQYAIGDIAPDTVSRYVLAVGSPTVATIANYQIDNLLGLVSTAARQPGQGQASSKSP
jgi:hypothetical protein